jgi:hypothetical protein
VHVDNLTPKARNVLKKPDIDTSKAGYDETMASHATIAYFSFREAGMQLNANGRVFTIVKPPPAFTRSRSTYPGGRTPVERVARAFANEFGAEGVSVLHAGRDRWLRRTAISLRDPMPAHTAGPQP